MTLTKEQLEERKHYIGGSDIASVMGKSRWGSPLSIWAKKTNKIQNEGIDNEDESPLYWGTVAEGIVADHFARKNKVKVRNYGKTYFHKDYPYMAANIDRLIESSDELLECKTAHEFKSDEWVEDDIPEEYVMQTQWYLGITGRKIGHIAVLIGGNKYKQKKIEFDPIFFSSMVAAAKDFWENYVLTNIAPEAKSNDKEILNKLFPEAKQNDDPVIIDDALVEKYKAKKLELKEIDTEIKELENKIKQQLGESEYGVSTGFKVTWKSQSRKSIDSKALKEDGLYDKYSTESSFRVLRFGKLK